MTQSPADNALVWIVGALPKEGPIVVATALVTPWAQRNHETIPMGIANFSTEANTLYKGSKVGELSPLDDEIKISSINLELDSYNSLTTQYAWVP